MQPKEEDQKSSTSSNPVLELEVAEEKLPMTLSRQEFLLGVWAKELNARQDFVKRSVQGRLKSATQKHTDSYLRPLSRKLQKRGLKRLMTMCQKHFPTDPSKCVEYNAL